MHHSGHLLTGHRKTRKTYNTPGHVHELTFSCYRRLPLLNKDRTRQWLQDALEIARSKYDADLLAYVIMPEHVHVLINPRQTNYDIAAIQKTLKQSVSRKALNWLKEHDPAFLKRLEGEKAGNRTRYHFWQPGGGYDRNIIEPETLKKAINYIHLNPVRRSLVNMPADWPWSSARQFAGIDDGSIQMDPLPL